MDIFLLPRSIPTRANLYGLVGISHEYIFCQNVYENKYIYKNKYVYPNIVKDIFFAKMYASKYKNKKHMYSNIVVR